MSYDYWKFENLMEWNGKGWKLTTSADELVIDAIERTKIFTHTQLSTIIIRRWLLSSHKFFGFGSARIIDTRTGYKIKLRGLSRLEQRKLENEISTILIEYDLNSSTSWKQNLDNLIDSAVNDLKPISESSRNSIKSSKPSDLTEQRLQSHKPTPEIITALSGLQVDYNELINKTNKQIQIVVELNSVDSWNEKLNELINNAKRNLELIKDKEREEIKSSKPSNEIFAHLSSLLHSNPPNKEAEKAVEILNTDIDKLIDTTNEHIQMTLDVNSVASWKKELDALTKGAMKNLKWISQEITEKIASEKPSGSMLERLKSYPSTTKTEKAISDLKIDVELLILNTNHRVLETEKKERKKFFDTIEKTPLTNEQAEAVISYDNRVQVVAAAGSGKTSVMVARSAYAIDKGFADPEKILLLAFNKNAAVELKERVNERLSAAGIPSEGVQASTFHALGLNIIANSSGKKPRIAPWVENGQDIKEILNIIDQLRDENEKFRYAWDMFRLLWGRPPHDEPDGGERDGYDSERKLAGFKTPDGKIVKSEGERIICTWLWANGVKYEYEKPYEIDTADVTHSQYHPDFYYPEINSWHEHFGVDANGKPPKKMGQDYIDGIIWKRNLHKTHSVNALIETTFYEVVTQEDMSGLQHELESRGIILDWNPHREVVSDVVIGDKDLAGLIRTFMTHIKSNQFTKSDVAARSNCVRTDKFLSLFWPIYEIWNENLRKNNYVDFDDMIARAVDALEEGDYDPGFDLILVDEFQDTSRSRINLVTALLNKENRFLMTVGDDWQSINRFAGADISAMTEFERWFGKSLQLKLSRTFRSPDLITKSASRFIMKNPMQIPKEVESVQESGSVTLIEASNQKKITQKISKKLSDISKVPSPNSEQKLSVFILGRYKHDSDLVPEKTPSNLNVQFKTIHGSKGLEADYVILPNLTTGKYGFPSEIDDDPILETVMTTPDSFEHAEERRLMYVALTRARKEVTLIAKRETVSPFVVEMMKDNLLETDSFAPEEETLICPECQEGLMVKRKGKNGFFLGCNRFPACKATINDDENDQKDPTSLCPVCKLGNMRKRTGKFGNFLGCSRYPKCNHTIELSSEKTKSDKPSKSVRDKRPCPTCKKGRLTKRSGKYGPFWGCSEFPACKYTRDV